MSKRNLPGATVTTRPGLKSDIAQKALSRWNPDVMAAADAGDMATISILEPIGEDWFGDGVTAKRIAGALRNIGDRDVTVTINSPGGDFFEGLAIYNMLVEHKGAVTVKVVGLAASAASVIAMAGDHIQIARAAFLMIHNTWVLAAGDRHAFRDVADWLEPFDAAAVDVYHARTGIAAPELAAMLDRETWISGKDAVERGFADGLLSDDAIEGGAQAAAELSPMAAQKKLDLYLAKQGMSRGDRRELVAALKRGTQDAAPSTGTPGAAGSGTPRAALADQLQTALDKLNTI